MTSNLTSYSDYGRKIDEIKHEILKEIPKSEEFINVIKIQIDLALDAWDRVINGQLKVPNDKSSTGDNNGTIGGGDEDNKFTYVVSVKNKENIITDNCDIWIGKSNNIVVDLPDGVKPTKEAPLLCSVRR